jgi:hypothetical protein
VLHRLNGPNTRTRSAICWTGHRRRNASPAGRFGAGFDNITIIAISPTLLESYTTAAAPFSAHGGWLLETPTGRYLAPGDTSQNQRRRLRPARRGGYWCTDFPADGEYKFSIQNFGIGSFIPGERLDSIDGERAHSLGIRRRAEPGHVRRGRRIARRHSGEAGSRVVGATFLATNYRPTPRLDPPHDQSRSEQQHPTAAYYPAIGFLRIRAVQRGPDDSRSRRRVLTCHPANSGASERECAHHPLTLARRAIAGRRPRRTSTR